MKKSNVVKILKNKNIKVLGLMLLSILMFGSNVFAADVDTTIVTSLFDIVIVVLRVFGGALAFIGAIDFFIGVFGGDPNSRNVGIKFFFGGVLVIALSAARSIFGI